MSLQDAEARLSVRQRFRIAKARSARLLARLSAKDAGWSEEKFFDEGKHPRDEHGRWTDSGGGDGEPSGFDVDKVEAKTTANVATASALARARGVTPLPGSKGQHPNIIASRNPTSKKITKVEYGQPDVASMKLDPKRYEHDIGLFSNADFYPNFRPADLSGSIDEAADSIVAQMKDNLKFLYQYADKSTQIWYDGARALVDDRVKLWGFNDASVAGVYAALSPTKDWDQNVHIADMLMQTYKNKQGHRWDDAMDEKSKTLWSKKNQAVVDLVRGKTLGELESPAEKALWIRTYDETHNDPSYRVVLPNGALGNVMRNKDGTPSKVIWQSLPSITNAVKTLEADGDLQKISAAMGTAHKVRSFFNNILDPHSANGDVTIDTHAVGAALLRQLSGSDVAVSHNFGNTPMKVDQPEGWEAAGSSVKTGSSGLYPVYAQAYREAAKELGIQPRQLQSAVWVVKRETFGDASKKTQEAVEAAWHEYHDNPKVTLAQTQAAIAKLVGLDKNERRSYRADEEGQRSGDAGELHRDGVGPAAAAVDGGAGKGAAERTAGLVVVQGPERRAGAEGLAEQEGLTEQWQLAREQARRLLRLFDEGAHPRDEHGRWTDAGGADDHPGEGYSKDAYVKDGVIHTDNVYDAARALHEGRRVELTQPRTASVLIDKLGEISRDMIAKGEKAPTFDLCKVTIKGTSLFCADSQGIPRLQMPQIRLGQDEAFTHYLKDKGYTVELEQQRASYLRATQSELNGGKVAAIAQKLRDQPDHQGNPLFVSNDDYILDGHHRWAAKIGLDAEDNNLTNDTKLAIARVDIPITKLLEEAEAFTGGEGKLSVADEAARKRAWALAREQAQALLRAKEPREDTEIELWPEEDESREDFMDRCVEELTKCVGPGKADRVCSNKWRKSSKLGKKGMVTREAIEALDDADLLIEPCGKSCIACEGADAPWSKAWNEADHPRVPAGGPGGGQFGEGGGSGASKPSDGKSKKPAKKEDFDKANITIGGGDNPVREKDFLDKWNEKIGIEPEEFKKNFLGGVPASMTIRSEMGTSKFEISGDIKGTGTNEGRNVGTYTRSLTPDEKEAYSAYFKLEKGATKHDTGKKVLAGNVEMYKQIGIEKVRVTANIDVGGYAWAKYGYVPEATAVWPALRTRLERKLTGGGSTSNRSENTMEADDWDQLPSDTQDDVRDRWMRDSRSEFLSNEEQNWRESGQAKNDAKIELADQFTNYQVAEGDVPVWVNEALDGARAYREERGQPPIPYTNRQLYDAVELSFKSNRGDGEDDPDVGFDDDMLKEPAGYDPAQGTLPGIEPEDPSERLTEDMRDRIEKRLIAAFDKKAEENAGEIDPPSYLNDSVDEYMDDSWSSMSDRDRLERARYYDMHYIPIEPDEEDAQAQMALEESHADPLLAALRSDDPKSLWKIADSPRGKELLLGETWNGVLDLKDPETMKRFNEYVGRAKHA